MRVNRSVAICAALTGIGCAAAVARQTAKTGESAAQPAPPAKTRFITINGENLKDNDATGVGEAINVKMVDGETVIRADHATWNKKSKTGEAGGNLSMTDPQADATGIKATIDWSKDKRLVIIDGGVTITVKPRRSAEDTPAPSAPAGVENRKSKTENSPMPVQLKDGKAVVESDKPKEDDSPRKHPVVITCDKLEYSYAKSKKHALLTGNFKAVQTLTEKTRTVTAHHAEWFGTEERLVLFPPVHFEDTKGTKGEGDPTKTVTIYTKEGDERIELPGKSTIELRSDEVDDEADVKPPAKPAAKKPQSFPP